MADPAAERAAALGLRPGQMVTSRAGRDRGRIFVVLAVEDGRFARVADGRLRPVTRPKRKNVRHLQAHGRVDAGLAAARARGEMPTDRAVRDAIAAFRRDAEGGGESAERGAGL
jgi:hypothetical protein